MHHSGAVCNLERTKHVLVNWMSSQSQEGLFLVTQRHINIRVHIFGLGRGHADVILICIL